MPTKTYAQILADVTENLTDDQIYAFLAEREAACDEVAAWVCFVALSTDEHGDGEHDHAEYLPDGLTTRTDARRLVADWIADARWVAQD